MDSPLDDPQKSDHTPQPTSESFFLDGMESNAYSGRYFCQEDETDNRRCLFCRQKGHLIRDCPKKTVNCPLCQQLHDPIKCPASELCFRCFRLGHIRKDCQGSFVRRYCYYCDRDDHATMECHLVWRDYVKNNRKTPLKRKIPMYCYNCGREGHYGDVSLIF